MKKILLTLGLLAGCLYTNAATGDRFSINIGDEYNPAYLCFEVLDEDAKTCELASPESYTITYTTQDVGYDVNIDVPVFVGNCSQTSNNGMIEIPGTVNGYTVVKIGDYCFANGNNINTINLPETVTEIGVGAFLGLYNLTIDISNIKKFGNYAFYSVGINSPSLKKAEEIGDYAFYNSNLSSVELNNAENIGKFAFASNHLSSLSLDGVEAIGEYAFFNNNISSLTMNGIVRFGKDAFGGSNTIQTLTLSNIPAIPDNAFAGKGLEKVTLENIETIGANAFQGNRINDLTLKGVNYIEDYAFDTNNIQGVDLSGVVTIGNNAFSNNSFAGDFTLTIPKTVESIGDNAFNQCGNIFGLIFEEGETELNLGEYVFANNGNMSNLVLSSRIHTIPTGAFSNCGSIKTVTFEEGLEYIADSAFEGCSGINGELHFPDSLLEIGNRAFYKVSSIEGIFFGKNLRKVGDEAFYNINMYPQAYWILPPCLTEIGENAFNTQDKVSTFTDIYYPNMYPTDINREGFGIFSEDENVKYDKVFWMYATVCLHVPMGTRDLYKQKEGWKYFRCIIDDLIPQNPSEEDDDVHTGIDDPLTYIIDYIYLTPNQDFDLNEFLVGMSTDSETGYSWLPVTNEENPDFKVLTLTEDGMVHAKSFGSHIAIVERTGNYKYNEAGIKVDLPNTIAGAVVIFVCPTITVVYDKENVTDGNVEYEGSQSASAPMKSVVRRAGEEDQQPNAPEKPEEGQALVTDNTSYTHYVLPSSLPKLEITPVNSISIQTIERANIDSDNTLTSELTQVADDLYDSAGNGGTIVPKDPINDNRLLAVTLAMNPGTMTEIEKVDISDKISIRTNGRILEIVGADDSSLVTVANINGQISYHGTAKVIELEAGIYVVKVEDVAFKAIVK